jgi:putative peptidoglycan lipid II flippase
VGEFSLAVVAAWGAVVGSVLQFLVQFPVVLRLLPRFRPVLDMASAHVRTVVRNFGPVFVGRGVVQVSGYVDVLLASLLPVGAAAGLTTAQTLYMLPVCVLGLSFWAAELPSFSSAHGKSDEVAATLRTRLDSGLRRIAFLVVPSAMVFLALGDVLAGALFQTGEFTRRDSVYVWAILAGSAVGLLANTLGRLYSSTYYALHDTRTPLRFAIVRVTLTMALGYLFAIPLPPLLGIDPRWGVAGLTASAGLAGWVEFALLRRGLNRRIGRTGLDFGFVGRLWLAAAVSAAVAWGVKLAMGTEHPILLAIAAFAPYGLAYFALTGAMGLPESRTIVRSIVRR